LKRRPSAWANRHSLCNAPQHVAEELLRAEGFTEIRYIDTRPADTAGTVAGGRVDFSIAHASYWIPALDAGGPVILLAGAAHRFPRRTFANPTPSDSLLEERNSSVRCCLGQQRRLVA
jgi:hypothetical protein